MERFEGRRALVTGAASGIGAATALRLAREGALVTGMDLAGPGGGRRPPPARILASELVFFPWDLKETASGLKKSASGRLGRQAKRK